VTSRETAEIFTSCESEEGKKTRKKRERQKVETKVTRRERKYDVKGGGEKMDRRKRELRNERK